MLTLEEVRNRIEQIRAARFDDEAAHSGEDDLRHDVLRAIAEGHPDAQALAREVLLTSEIPFSRWCA